MATVASPTWLAAAALLGVFLPPLSVRAEEAEAQRPSPPDALPAGMAAPEAGLSITSDSDCPSGPAVVAALAALCPSVAWPSGIVRIRAAADTLAVELVSETMTQRQLKVADDCSARATTVALVIATWTGELSSEAAGEPVLRRPAGARSGDVAPNFLQPAVAVAANEREIGAGLLMSVSGGGVAPGIAIDFVQTRAPRGLGWQAGLSLPARRESSAPAGTTTWTRATASVAVNGRVTAHRFVLSASAGLAGAYTSISARGYPIEQGEQALTGGVVAGARAAYSRSRLRLWTGVHCYQWLLPQSVVVEGPSGARVASFELPSTDVQWAVGAAYVFR